MVQDRPADAHGRDVRGGVQHPQGVRGAGGQRELGADRRHGRGGQRR